MSATSNKPAILMVDDERPFSMMTQEYLESKGHRVVLKHDAKSAIRAFKMENFDLCVLDVKMPIKDGFALAQEIRELNERIPIIFLTGQTQKDDRIKGLSLGADDYITKPFSMEELNLRIVNTLKRVRFEKQARNEIEKYNISTYLFDPSSRVLKSTTETIKLTAIESKLLHLFCEHKNEVVVRAMALKRIWGDDDLLRGRSLNVYMSKLRQLFKTDENVEFLNVHGIGYKMVVKSDS